MDAGTPQDRAWSRARGRELVRHGDPSRRPFVESRTVALPSDDRDGDRVAQIAHIDWEGGAIIANLHLTHLRDAGELRRRQLETLLAHESMQDAERHAILCGDFNMPSAARPAGRARRSEPARYI